MSYLLRSASLTNYVEVARSVGLDPYQRLSAVGISRYALLDPDIKIPAEAVVSLLEASAHAAGTEDFGLRMAETRQLSNLGPLAVAVREEPTLRKAVELMGRYLRLHNEALTMRIEDVEGLVIIREEMLSERPGSQRQAIELALGVLYRMLQVFLGSSWRPRSICFTHAAPASNATHMRVFGTAILFGQDFDGIVCRTTDLEVPVPSYDPAMAYQVRRYLDTRLAQIDANIVDKVYELVRSMLPEGTCSVERVAQQLGVGRRTVHHRLSHHGQSYSAIVNAVRDDLAIRYIGNRERPLSEVAKLLGFSSLSAFSRWFSGHLGCSVSQWRARSSDEGG